MIKKWNYKPTTQNRDRALISTKKEIRENKKKTIKKKKGKEYMAIIVEEIKNRAEGLLLS